MCGISGAVGKVEYDVQTIGEVQAHRGPDNFGFFEDVEQQVLLCHNRLSIIDLTVQANQPLTDNSGRFVIIFNGEVYNYIELREKIDNYFFKTRSDTEVVLAAYIKWGPDCLTHFIGMFSLAIWDKQEKKLFAARDRFGVKPFHFTVTKSSFFFGSEIKSLFAFGLSKEFDVQTWSTYLDTGMYDHSEFTFWKGAYRLLPGHYLTYSLADGLIISQWYDLPGIILKNGVDRREESQIVEELTELLIDSVKLRFRSDVPVGILLSGGLDSSLLWGLVEKAFGSTGDINTFTFFTDSAVYDESDWVRKLLGAPTDKNHFCELRHQDVPQLCMDVQKYQEEPFGGFPTLAFSLLHKRAKEVGIKVLLDGNGIDEGWAGYDYYEQADKVLMEKGPVQSARSEISLSPCLNKDFRMRKRDFVFQSGTLDKMQDLQYRDIMFAKIPRAMRFADRVSMMHSRELREPMLDHRIIELGMAQPAINKIRNGVRKYLVRQAGKGLIKNNVLEATKRPVQTPQREWLKNELKSWTLDHIENVLSSEVRDWMDVDKVRSFWKHYQQHDIDNSFPVWQLVSLSLMLETKRSN